MPTPLAPPPDNAVAGSSSQAASMRAVRLRNRLTLQMTPPNGPSKQVDVPAGTIGYLIRELPEDYCLCEMISDRGGRQKFEIRRKHLEIGKPHSEFSLYTPQMRQASQAATISTQRANDPAGRAIRFMWDDIHANLSILADLGLRSNVYEGTLNNPTKKGQALNTIIASWTALNTPGLPLDAFRNIPRITSSWPRLQLSQTLVYLRLYVDGSRFAKYGGITTREYPIRRQWEHEEGINSDKNTPHYREARTYPKPNRHAIPMMLLSNVDNVIISMAETTLCSLLQTWHKDAVRPSQRCIQEELNSGAVESIEHQTLMSALATINHTALRRANYPILGGAGCNWNLPLQDAGHERREWIRWRTNTTDQRSMLIYRWQSAVTQLRVQQETKLGVDVMFTSRREKTSENKSATWAFKVQQVLEGLPGIKRSIPIIISIELMEDGKPHSVPWYRGPLHGAWINCHELHSFAINVEWLDEKRNQWYSYPLQPLHFTTVFSEATGDKTVTSDWRKATCILQFLHNRRYRNPPAYLESTFRPLIKQVMYDHLSQTVRFEEVLETIMDPPSQVSSEHNLRLLGQASKTYWPDIVVGRMPSPQWFGRVDGSSTTACAMCIIMRRWNKKPGIDCAKRKGDFNVAANEDHRDMILQGSCRLCWEYYRRPCIWVKLNFSRDHERALREGHEVNLFLPPEYEGAAFREKYAGPAIAIGAPMSLAAYQEIKVNEEELAATMAQFELEPVD
ncbi:hypothetical protein ACHAQC_011288 [Fusarium culmorum]